MPVVGRWMVVVAATWGVPAVGVFVPGAGAVHSSWLFHPGPTPGGGGPGWEGARHDAPPPDASAPIVAALAILPDGTGYLTGSQAGVTIYHHTDEAPRTFPTDLEQVRALAFSPSGDTLAVGGGTPAVSGSVELRSWPSGALVRRIDGHGDLVDDVVWLDGGALLASAGADRLVTIWDAGTGLEQAVLEGHSGPVRALAVDPGGEVLCSGSVDGTVRVWEVGTWRLARTLANHLDAVHGLAFRPAGPGSRLPLLASAGEDATVRIWQPTIGRMVRIVRHPAPVLAVSWGPGGEHVATASKDGMLRLVAGGSDAILSEHRVGDGWLTAVSALGDGRFLIGTSSGGAVAVDAMDPRP